MGPGVSWRDIRCPIDESGKPKGGPKMTDEPRSAAPDPRTTLEQFVEAWSDLDPAKVARFYATDPDLAFFDVAPMKYSGWAELAAGVSQALADYRSLKLTFADDLRVHQSGEMAWITATWRADLARKDGGAERMAGRYTAVMEKRGAAWLFVHEHLSVPAGGAQA